MKKVFFLIAFTIFVTGSYSQSSLSNALIGIHVGKVELEPDVTLNQWKKYALEKYLPAFNEEFKGEITVYMADGERGPYEGYIAFYMVFKTLEIRDKYIPEMGKRSELYQEKWKSVQPYYDELLKMGEFTRDHWTDWVVL